MILFVSVKWLNSSKWFKLVAHKRIVLETMSINTWYAYIMDKVLSLPFNCQLANQYIMIGLSIFGHPLAYKTNLTL